MPAPHSFATSSTSPVRDTLERLFRGQTLSRDEAYRLMDGVLDETVPAEQVSALAACLRMRLPTVHELAGFRESVWARASHVELDARDAIDMVGTGGDGLDTFNITTLSALTVAACGVRVVKHGNGSASSKHGSSDTLRAAGLGFRQNEGDLRRQLDAAGITFLHAPLFHPVLGRVAALRKRLGVGTFFNLLGPLLNPASPGLAYIGVADAATQGLYDELFRGFAQAHLIVHSNDGYDEATLTGPVRCYSARGRRTLQARDFGLPPCTGAEIVSEADALAQFRRIVAGEGTAAETNNVAANAGLALQLADQHREALPVYTARARERLLGGHVKTAFDKLLAA